MRNFSTAFRGILVILFAIGMTWIFWAPLWNGGGLVGGDIYPYYFPQKAFLADRLAEGIVPLWNPLVGFGYPTLGESQTGVLYPPNLILYSQFDLNTAYNLSQLLHYFIAFVATWGLARSLGLTTASSLLTAMVFVYGWFPARICLEWSIVGGAWFAAILWAASVYLQTAKKWALACLPVFLGMDLLAGHYHLAFITLIVLFLLPFLLQPKVQFCHSSVQKLLIISCAVALGFMIAAVQIIPSWELKTLSQRQDVNEAFTPTYGHMPPAAISQLWQPWSWYAGELTPDEYLAQADWLSVPNATNQAEAYLYCGLLTLVLIVIGVCLPQVRNNLTRTGSWRWMVLAGFSLIMATGWPTHYLSWLPGLGFFRGPGRYSMIAAFAFAVLSGASLDAIFRWRNFRQSQIWIASIVCFAVIAADLWSASRQYHFGAEPYFGRQVFYATMVDVPPIDYRDQSQLRDYFARQSESSTSNGFRLYAPGPNIPSLLGVSSIPVYLGLGPEIYESDEFRFDFTIRDPAAIKDDRERLLQFGVTHLLLETPIDHEAWNVTFLGAQFDELLNRALARQEPFYFYELNNALGRVSINSEDGVDVQLKVNSSANFVAINATAEKEFTNGSVTLRDLSYPGWQPEPQKDQLFRRATWNALQPQKEFSFIWTYQPSSVQFGIAISVLGLLLTFVLPFCLPGTWINTLPEKQ